MDDFDKLKIQDDATLNFKRFLNKISLNRESQKKKTKYLNDSYYDSSFQLKKKLEYKAIMSLNHIHISKLRDLKKNEENKKTRKNEQELISAIGFQPEMNDDIKQIKRKNNKVEKSLQSN